MVALASLYGWRHFHPLNMRGSDPGWPDLTLARTPELLFAELKTDRGRLSPHQRSWIELLLSCGMEVHVWRPRDFDAIHARLKRRGAPSRVPMVPRDLLVDRGARTRRKRS